MRHRLAIAIALLSFVRPVTLPAQTIGAYLADRIDQAPLPMTDRVTDPQGTTYLVEFERLVLSLRGGDGARDEGTSGHKMFGAYLRRRMRRRAIAPLR